MPQSALSLKRWPVTGWKSFFTSSGTEANETAILAARCFTGSSEIIALRHSYHGRSSLAMGLSGQSGWKVGPPAQAGITFAHNAYCYRCPFGLTYPSCEIKCAQDIQELIRSIHTERSAAKEKERRESWTKYVSLMIVGLAVATAFGSLKAAGFGSRVMFNRSRYQDLVLNDALGKVNA